MKNIGLDFYLLSDRISGSFDFFRNDITRLLGYASTSPLAIYETRPVNGGHYYRRGWELMLDTKTSSENLHGTPRLLSPKQIHSRRKGCPTMTTRFIRREKMSR